MGERRRSNRTVNRRVGDNNVCNAAYVHRQLRQQNQKSEIR